MFIKTYKTYKKKSERYPKQLLYFVSQHKRKTKCIVDKCSNLTCTKKYALTKGPKRGGGGNVGHSLSPPSHFMLATGLPSRCLFQSQEYKLNHLHIKRNEYRFIRYRGMLEAHETLL